MTALLGIDLTASEKRASTFAALDGNGRFLDMGFARTDDDILDTVRRFDASLVGIDSPLGLPQGYCCLEESCDCGPTAGAPGRSAERALSKAGIPLFWTTKRSIIKKMVYRGMSLAEGLEVEGRQVLEVYPYGAKVRLWGRRMPKKSTPEGLDFLIGRVAELIPGVSQTRTNLDHDLCDALLAAYTVYLLTQDKTEAFGAVEERQILLPAAGL
ncbi:MAG: putative nuclease (RNAse H fold) [Chloroflexi bacterium]|nr:MAG: putative nuclease (RNAse H fold) [Chloroflexota bacterium]